MEKLANVCYRVIILASIFTVVVGLTAGIYIVRNKKCLKEHTDFHLSFSLQ